MNIRAYITIALITCTAYIFPAAQGSSSTAELAKFGTFIVVKRKSKIPTMPTTWAQDPTIEQRVAYHKGSDGCGVCAHHTITDIVDPLTGKIGKTDNFGCAVVLHHTDSRIISVTADAFKQLANAQHPYFEIKENYILTTNNRPITTAPKYALSIYPCRFMFLCHDAKLSTEVNDLLKRQASTLDTLIAAASFLRVRIPTTTFVLFDIADYCKNVLGEYDTEQDTYSAIPERSQSR